jgi:hypothetical protein
MITLSWYYDNMLSYFFFLKTSHTAMVLALARISLRPSSHMFLKKVFWPMMGYRESLEWFFQKIV